MPTNYKKEWMEKSSIEYFSLFISLWLACNSWYEYHYSDKPRNDRSFINEIKMDTTGRNHLYAKFADLIDMDGKEGISFRTNIELLHYALERAILKPTNIDLLSFQKAVIDYSNINITENLIVKPKFKKDGSLYSEDERRVIKLDRIYITNDKSLFFSGLFEIIYQVRNMLVHGMLNPGKDEHNVVKYCYLILWDLMA